MYQMHYDCIMFLRDWFIVRMATDTRNAVNVVMPELTEEARRAELGIKSKGDTARR